MYFVGYLRSLRGGFVAFRRTVVKECAVWSRGVAQLSVSHNLEQPSFFSPGLDMPPCSFCLRLKPPSFLSPSLKPTSSLSSLDPGTASNTWVCLLLCNSEPKSSLYPSREQSSPPSQPGTAELSWPQPSSLSPAELYQSSRFCSRV